MLMTLSSSVKTKISLKIEEYEGRYNHLYLDSLGKITIGIGHLVKNRNAVSSIAMYSTKNSQPFKLASLIEKQTEYDAMAKQKKGYKASWYKQHTKLIMKDIDIDTQLKTHISSFYKELTDYYKKTNGFKSDFDNFPINVQIALFDMTFNLGITRLKNTFTKFNNAIQKEDWATAAKQSNRPQVNGIRNAYVKGLFNGITQKNSTIKP